MAGTFDVIDIAEYKAHYADNDSADYVLIDVRETDEYADGRIPGAINIPLSEMEARYTEIPQDKPVILACGVGGRSGQAAAFVAAQGWDNLINLDGGTMGWIQAGHPLETD